MSLINFSTTRQCFSFAFLPRLTLYSAWALGKEREGESVCVCKECKA